MVGKARKKAHPPDEIVRRLRGRAARHDASFGARRYPSEICTSRTALAQIGIIGFDGQIELEALRLYGLPGDAPAVLYACLSLPAGTRTLALETSLDLPSLAPGATVNVDITVPGARRGDLADASLDTSSIALVLDCHVWSNTACG